MHNDETKTEEKKSTPASSLLDEVRAERIALEKLRDEAKAEANRLEQLRANEMLSGTAGIRQEAISQKPETAKQYRKRIQMEVAQGKYD